MRNSTSYEAGMLRPRWPIFLITRNERLYRGWWGSRTSTTSGNDSSDSLLGTFLNPLARWAGLEEGSTGGCEAAAIDGLKDLWHFESGIWKVWKSGREHAVMAAMKMAAAELPDDVDALKAMIIAMAEQQASLEARTSHLEVVSKTADERIATLTAIVRMLERSRYGTRSERLRGATLSDEQHAFAFDEINTGLAAIEAELDGSAGDKPKRAPRSRKGFAADLERVEIVIEPEFPPVARGWRRFRSARTYRSVWTWRGRSSE